MDANSFVSTLKRIATEYETVYAWGMFGSRITKSSVNAKAKQYPDWYTGRRLFSVFEPLYKRDTAVWGFDCIGLIKAVLWGWNGSTGAKYASNGVPDVSADTMITKCSEVSSDFGSVAVGEFLWMKGHCGIYIGDGKVVESTPKWENGVQITRLSDRAWFKHGKLPYVEYKGAKMVSVDLPTLALGSKTDEVKALQRLLESHGYRGKDKNILTVDGDFGTNTDYALRAFQKAKKLTVDGVCGKNTWNKILKE